VQLCLRQHGASGCICSSLWRSQSVKTNYNKRVTSLPAPAASAAFVAWAGLETGGYPWGGSFGIGGAIATELAVPVDHRTTDLGTSVEFALGSISTAWRTSAGSPVRAAPTASSATET